MCMCVIFLYGCFYLCCMSTSFIFQNIYNIIIMCVIVAHNFGEDTICPGCPLMCSLNAKCAVSPACLVLKIHYEYVSSHGKELKGKIKCTCCL